MPLPTPRINESENEFIARCIVDAEIEEEYATMSQRIAVCYSQLDQKVITKSKNYDTQKYYQGYQRQLDIAERQEVRKVASYYANQYDQAIQKFLATGQTNNFQGIFKEEDIQNIYTNIYVNIGLRISKWYQSNYEKYTKKADANLSDNFFAGKFRYISQLVGAGRVRSVSQNKQQTLDRVLKKLMADPDFQSMNERDAQRLLRQQFKGISKYQAERIIRTESTLAANYATEQTARQMFNEQDMQKEWISGGDSRVRRLPRNKADHRTMNGKVVDADKKFEVPTRNGVEMMLYPGDPGASSFNLINCRCTVAYIPREDAQAQIDIQGFGVQDLGTLERVGENFGVIVNPVAQVAEEVVEETPQVSYDFSNTKEVKQAVTDILEENNMSLGRLMLPKKDNIDFDFVSKNVTQFARLTRKYNLSNGYNDGSMPTFSMASTKTVYGVIKRQKSTFKGEYRWHTKQINIGNEIPPVRDLDDVNPNIFSTRNSPRIDYDKMEIYVTTHEFAHLISSSRIGFYVDAQDQLEFFKELRTLRSQYMDELTDLKLNKNDYFNYNKVYLGKYAATNIDEFFAEAFADFELNATPSKYALKVGELVTKYFAK